jgi:hypothetical protein
VAGSSPLGAGFMVLAAGTTYAGPLLAVLAIGFLWRLEPVRGRTTLRAAAVLAAVLLPALALVGWQTGVLPDWARQFRLEYWDDLVDPERRVPSARLFGAFLLLTGALPLYVPVAWRRLSLAGRVLGLTGAAYLLVVLVISYKILHYLMPLPWILAVPALEASGARLRVAAAGLLAVTFALSWPDDRAVSRHTIALGSESCIDAPDYEAAALGSEPIYQALDRPERADRFAVSRLTFVRYAIDLGGRDCVLGLSRTTPSGAITLVDGPIAVWTADPDRFAGWRLETIPRPSSLLFPRPQPRVYGKTAADWTGRLEVWREPAGSLLLTGFLPNADNPSVRMADRARLLIPVPHAGRADVRLGVRTQFPARVDVLANGQPAVGLILEPGQSEVAVPAAWRTGWNVLELRGGTGVELEWLDAGG